MGLILNDQISISLYFLHFAWLLQQASIFVRITGEESSIFADMAYKGSAKVQKVMVQPINLIFRYLQNKSRVQIWLYEQTNVKIEGCIIGFDEYMNVVLDDAEEVCELIRLSWWHLNDALCFQINTKLKNRANVGRILLKGDNITLIQLAEPVGVWLMYVM